MHQQPQVAVELRVVRACRALGALAEHRLQKGDCRRETVRRVLGQAVVMAQRRRGCEQLPGGAVWFVEHRHAAPKAQHLLVLLGAAAQ